MVFSIPLLIYPGAINYIIPLAMNEIPFIREIKPTWIHNPFPSIYIVIFRFVL